MGSKYFTVNEFIKVAKLDWWLFSQSDDPWWLNPIDKQNIERIIAKLVKIAILSQPSIEISRSF